MYSKNYSDVIRFLDSRTPLDLTKDRYKNFSEPDNMSEIIDCTSGWNYDRRMFPNTVVMEVGFI